MQLIDDRIHGKRLEPEERELGRPIDYVTPRTLVRARITATADAAKAPLARMEADGLLIGQDVSPKGGGPTTRILRIPMKSDSCSNPYRTLVPIGVGQMSERSDARG